MRPLCRRGVGRLSIDCLLFLQNEAVTQNEAGFSRLLNMVHSEWTYAVAGTIASLALGAQMPGEHVV